MAYCTYADVTMQLADQDITDLSDDSGVGALDADVVDRAIDDADAEIDGYLGSRYALPLASTPAILRKLSVDVAIYNLYSRRGNTIPDVRKDRYDKAVTLLDGIRAGDVSLGSTAPSADSDAGPAATTYRDDRVFTRGSDTAGTSGTLDNY